jgi:hypothetical protein
LYTIKVDWKADLFCGITTQWNYDNRTVSLSMPGYIDDLLREVRHPMSLKKAMPGRAHDYSTLYDSEFWRYLYCSWEMRNETISLKSDVLQ